MYASFNGNGRTISTVYGRTALFTTAGRTARLAWLISGIHHAAAFGSDCPWLAQTAKQPFR